MSIFDIFRSANPAAGNNPAIPSPGNPASPTLPAPGSNGPQGPIPGTQNSNQTAPNGVVPTQTGDVNKGGDTGQVKDESPLAGFAETWKTTGTATEESISDLFAKFDPQKAIEAASKVDFTKVIDPATATKIAAGGEDAIKAFMESLNKVAQNVYGNSAVATAKIVQEALTKADGIYSSKLQKEVTRLASRDALVTANPLLNHPSVQPLVEAAQEMFIRKNPNATQSEIQQQVNDYFGALGKAFGPKSTSNQSNGSGKTGPKEEDWSKFFE